jgi:hypothetical protein
MGAAQPGSRGQFPGANASGGSGDDDQAASAGNSRSAADESLVTRRPDNERNIERVLLRGVLEDLASWLQWASLVRSDIRSLA